MMILLERNQDVTIFRADRAGGVIRDVDGTIRQADRISNRVYLIGRNTCTDLFFDVEKQGAGFFDPHADGPPHVKCHRTCIYCGKEVASQKR